MASPFSPETREATLAALPAAALDVLVIGGGITGAGVARAPGRARRAARLGRGHLEPQLEADPRWRALPRAGRRRPGARGGDGAERAAPPGAPPGAPRPHADADLRPRGAREARPRSLDLRAHRHRRARRAARDVEPRGGPRAGADARRHAPPRRRHLHRVPD